MSKHYRFTKMHGCGNDFILFDCFDQSLYDPETMALILSDRHVGIGGDGIVTLSPSDEADISLRFYNTDGTEAPLCGNGLRCAVKLAVDHCLTENDTVTVETRSGVLTASLLPATRSKNGKTVDVRVDLGAPAVVQPDMHLTLGGKELTVTTVRVGGLFRVISGEANRLTDPAGDSFDIDRFDFAAFASAAAADAPDCADIAVTKTLNKTTLAMRVWERGNGETRACGTGACAAVTAACRSGVCAYDTDVTVRLMGGDMIVRCEAPDKGGRVLLTGQAATVFDGDILF